MQIGGLSNDSIVVESVKIFERVI